MGEQTPGDHAPPVEDDTNVVRLRHSRAHPPLPPVVYETWDPTTSDITPEEMYRTLIRLVESLNASLGKVIDRVIALEGAPPDRTGASLADKALCWDRLVGAFYVDTSQDPVSQAIREAVELANQTLTEHPF